MTRLRAFPVIVALAVTAVSLDAGRQPQSFQVEETTIARIHAAMKSGQLTCRALVEQYLQRIEKYDKAGPAFNAIVVVNPQALAEADDLDRRARQGGLTGPLHCVPAIVKDNFETIGLQSAAGSLSLKGFVSDRDAFQVKRIKAAGAIVLAKSNMAEFAFTPYETVSSILRAIPGTHTTSIVSPPDRAAARPPPSPRTSAPSASAATPAIRFVARRRIRRWRESVRPWG